MQPPGPEPLEPSLNFLYVCRNQSCGEKFSDRRRGPRKPREAEKVSGYRIGDLKFSDSRLGQFGLPGIRLKKLKTENF